MFDPCEALHMSGLCKHEGAIAPRLLLAGAVLQCAVEKPTMIGCGRGDGFKTDLPPQGHSLFISCKASLSSVHLDVDR